MQRSNNEVGLHSTSAAGVLTSLDFFSFSTHLSRKKVNLFSETSTLLLQASAFGQLALGLIAHGFINPCKRDSKLSALFVLSDKI